MADRRSVIGEMFILIKRTKAYWLVPVMLLILFSSLLALLGSSVVAPFIYTMF